MNKRKLPPPLIALPPTPPLYLPAPKFQLGQRVYWKALSNPDFGHILGVVWATEASVKAIGSLFRIAGSHFPLQFLHPTGLGL